MSDEIHAAQPMSRITAIVHHRISDDVIRVLKDIGAQPVLVEPCRSVRQVRRPRPFRLPGFTVGLDDSPGDRFHITIARENSLNVMRKLVQEAGLDIPGHGTIYLQDVLIYAAANSAHGSTEKQTDISVEPPQSSLLKDLSQITCILSHSGAGEQLARIALDLGTCVPMVTLGIGTGIRDRLGLLRITIPPEKELVHLLVPAHDVYGIMLLLIENGRLARPSGGFVYQTPVRTGLVDTRLRIGKQEHAASTEQIIAAIDELKQGTTWRKRFWESATSYASLQMHMMENNCEIITTCPEGDADQLVSAAMQAGAGGATIARVKRIADDSVGGNTAARERSTIIVPSRLSDRIVQALLRTTETHSIHIDSVEVLDSPLAYSYGS